MMGVPKGVESPILISLKFNHLSLRAVTIFEPFMYSKLMVDMITYSEHPNISYEKTIHPARLTWNLRIRPPGKGKSSSRFQTIMFRFHVNLRGCMGFSMCIIELNESLHLLLYCVTTETGNGILGIQCASPKPGTFKNFQKMDL